MTVIYYDVLYILVETAPATWTDITADVIQHAGIMGTQGIRGSSPTDRVASTGTLIFTLRNDDGNSSGLANRYTPGNANALPGFTINARVLCQVEYGGVVYTQFYGKIQTGGIRIVGEPYVQKTVVTCVDFMEECARHEMYLPEFAQDKYMNDVVGLVIDNMPMQPLAEEYDPGIILFETVFDTVRPRTRALSEFQKVALSELGYIYLRQISLLYPTTAEILRVENQYYRLQTEDLARVGEWTTLLLDEFTDSDGTSLTSHAISPTNPDALSWTTDTATHKITSNTARPIAAATSHSNEADIGIADCVIRVTVRTGETDGVNDTNGIEFRGVDSDNVWIVQVSKLDTRKFCIVDITGGTQTVKIMDDTFVYQPNTDYNLVISLFGNDMTAKISGGHNSSIHYSSTVRNTATKFGFRSFIQTTVTNYPRFDNFEIISTEDQESAIFDNSAKKLKITHGDGFYNSIRAFTYPREVDDSYVVLFELQRTIEITPTTTVVITGRYADPAAKASKVSGIDMQAPVEDTDWKFNTAADLTGSDISGDLDLSVAYGTDGVEYTARNDGAGTGFFWARAKGLGVYIYDTVEQSYQDPTSIADVGEIRLDLDLKYLSNPLVADDYGNALLYLSSTAITMIKEATFVANRSEILMWSFLQLQIGDRIRIISDINGIDQDFFINGRSWIIKEGGVIEFTYFVSVALSGVFEDWELGVAGKSELGVNTVLGI